MPFSREERGAGKAACQGFSLLTVEAAGVEVCMLDMSKLKNGGRGREEENVENLANFVNLKYLIFGGKEGKGEGREERARARERSRSILLKKCVV